MSTNQFRGDITYAGSWFGADDSPAAQLTQYVCDERFERLPPEVIRAVLVLIEDNVGCALGALGVPGGASFLNAAPIFSGPGSVLAIGKGRTTLEAAVFCNTSLANLLDFDDMYDYFLPYHLGCLIIPPALAVSEAVGASAEQLLTAVATAYEVTMRIGRSLGNGLRRGGLLFAFPALAQIAAGIVSAKLSELDAHQLRLLFSVIAMDEGIGGAPFIKHDVPGLAQIGLLKGNNGTLAQRGVAAVSKARAGLSGRSGFLESNFSDWYRAGFPSEGYGSLTGNLGQEYLCPKMSLKVTPSCWMSQAPIAAARQALQGRHLNWEDVERIRVLGVTRLERNQWSNMPEAEFSLPCALALAISGIEPGPKWYGENAYQSPEIKALSAKIIQEDEPEAHAREILSGRIASRVRIEMKRGPLLEGECRIIKGTPENPLSAEERTAKWSANTTHLPRDVAQRIRVAIQGLAQASSCNELISALSDVTV